MGLLSGTAAKLRQRHGLPGPGWPLWEHAVTELLRAHLRAHPYPGVAAAPYTDRVLARLGAKARKADMSPLEGGALSRFQAAKASYDGWYVAVSRDLNYCEFWLRDYLEVERTRGAPPESAVRLYDSLRREVLRLVSDYEGSFVPWLPKVAARPGERFPSRTLLERAKGLAS